MTNVGSWDKLSDGSWGVMVRCGGRGAEMVGRTIVVRRKDRSTSNVTAAELSGELEAAQLHAAGVPTLAKARLKRVGR
jgi:hypothetical protein